jgi:hypothetical protein
VGVPMSGGGGVRHSRRRVPSHNSPLEHLLAWVKPYSLAFAMAGLGVMVGAGGVVLGSNFNGESSPSFWVELAKALLSLGTGLILGGALKALLDAYQGKRKQREEDYELRERLLGDLRDVYDRMERARLMISAYKSGNDYFDHMRELIGCQAMLLKFKRAVDIRGDSTKDVDPHSVYLSKTIGYLRALQNEYARNYMSVAECQRYDDKITDGQLSELVDRH